MQTDRLANHIKCTHASAKSTNRRSYHNNHSKNHLPYKTGDFPKWMNLQHSDSVSASDIPLILDFWYSNALSPKKNAFIFSEIEMVMISW